MSRERLSRKPEDWSLQDQAARGAAYNRGEDELDDVGLASHWRPATKGKGDKGYGMWIGCLQRHGRLTDVANPVDRVTRDNLKLFVRDLQSRNVASETLAGYVRDLREMIRVMNAGQCPDDLVRLSLALGRAAQPSRDQRDQMVSPSELFFAGIKRMKQYWEAAAIDALAAVRYGDGLMMSTTSLKPIRLRNLSGMLLEHNIARNQLAEYELKFKPNETKTKRAIKAPLPVTLTPYFDRWFKCGRRTLLAGRESDAMWIAMRGADMSVGTVYDRFCRATLKETGCRINPHLTRKMMVTGLAIGAPNIIELAPAALDHASRRHTREAYDLADDLTASAVVNAVVDSLRADAFKRMS